MTDAAEPGTDAQSRDRVVRTLAQSSSMLVDLVPQARSATFGRLLAVWTGLPVAFFNSAIAAEQLTARDADDLAHAVAWLGSQGLPHSVQLTGGRDDEVIEAVLALGLVADEDLPGMLLELDGGAATIPSAPTGAVGQLEIRTVDDDRSRAEHGAVLATGFDMPPEWPAVLLANVVPPPADWGILTGYVDAEPVAVAAASVVGDSVAVFNVATLPEHRRRGYGEAMTFAAVRFGAERGCTAAVLQASDAAHRVYRRMGFRDVASGKLYISQ
jgi:ribosomal protein S18 acetylase RimI-like enzyme